MLAPVVACLLAVGCGVGSPHMNLGRVDAESSARLMTWIDTEEAAGAASVEIYIDSPGGDVDAGFALIERLDTAGPEIHCTVSGRAASMAFAILQSCDVRVMSRGAYLMAHEARLNTPATDIGDLWDLHLTNEALAVQCSRHLNLSLEQYRERVANGAEWWIYPDEALRVGAVDRLAL